MSARKAGWRRVKRVNMEKRRLEVEQLYLRGETQRGIAEKLGISQPTVHRDLALLTEEWKTARLENWDAHVAAALKRCDHGERIAWGGYEECLKAFRESKRVVVTTKGAEEVDRDPTAEGKVAPPRTRKHAVEQTKQGPGDAGFMTAAASHHRIALDWCHRRNEILGVYAPKLKAWRKDELARRLADGLGVNPEALPN